MSEPMIETFISKDDAEIFNEVKSIGIETVEDLREFSGPPWFLMFPAKLLLIPHLSLEAKVIYCMLLGIIRATGKCSPSNEYLSKNSLIPDRSLRRALKELRDMGFIHINIKKKPYGTWRIIHVNFSQELGLTPSIKSSNPPAKLAADPPAKLAADPPAKLATHTNIGGIVINKHIMASPLSGHPPTLKQTTEASNETASAVNAVPTKSAVHRLVKVWGSILGLPKEDREAWNKANFARCAKAAKILTEIFRVNGAEDSDLEPIVDCMVDIYEQGKKGGYSVTLETVARKASEWRLNHANNSQS